VCFAQSFVNSHVHATLRVRGIHSSGSMSGVDDHREIQLRLDLATIVGVLSSSPESIGV
jgi:hypothetical protein